VAITGFATRARLAKAGGADNWVSGMDTATEMLAFLEHIGSDVAGCILAAKRRKEGGNNAQIVEYLADNNPPRNIAPTAEDHAQAAEIIKGIILVRLRMMAKRGHKRLKKWDASHTAMFVASGKKIANSIASTALRKAGQQMQANMRERVEAGLYPLVSEDYAAWRLAKYGVPPGRVFVATGQLLSNITDGHIRLIKKPTLFKMIKGGLKSMIGGGAEALAGAVSSYAKS